MKRNVIGQVHCHCFVIIKADAPSADVKSPVLCSFKSIEHIYHGTSIVLFEIHFVLGLSSDPLFDIWYKIFGNLFHISNERWVS